MALAAANATPALAQVGLTEIVGSATDASGAVLPGVTITATQGRWNFVFELAGFPTVRIEDFELNVGRRPTLNVTLELAGVTETVTVQAETPLIETTRAELSDVVQDIQVEELPILGRDWMGFTVIAAGIKSDGAGSGSDDTTPTAGIGVGRQDKVVIDGADVNNRSTSRNVDIKLSKEIIAEFEVKTNQFDARFGQSGTSITQAITKSGTDQFRGSALFFFRDESLNAEDFFIVDDPATPENEAKPPFRNEQVGGAIGGPIVPGKTHFFFSYERQKYAADALLQHRHRAHRSTRRRHRYPEPVVRSRRSSIQPESPSRLSL